MSITVRLADDVDVSRGDMLADPEQAPTVARELEATVCWMAEKPLEPRAKLAIKHTTRTVRAIVDELVSVVDIHTLEDQPGPERLELNDIARVRLRLSRAAGGRRLRGQPRHGRLHPDRRVDERHGRRRDDPLRRRVAPGDSTLAPSGNLRGGRRVAS